MDLTSPTPLPERARRMRILGPIRLKCGAWRVLPPSDRPPFPRRPLKLQRRHPKARSIRRITGPIFGLCHRTGWPRFFLFCPISFQFRTNLGRLPPAEPKSPFTASGPLGAKRIGRGGYLDHGPKNNNTDSRRRSVSRFLARPKNERRRQRVDIARRACCGPDLVGRFLRSGGHQPAFIPFRTT